jgi:neuromedin U receptor 1
MAMATSSFLLDVNIETAVEYTIVVDTLINTEQTSSNSSLFDVDSYVRHHLGSRTRGLPDSVALSIVYGAIFITGLLGNACTCVVIVTNAHMHTATNYYLFSLAVSDVLTLIIGELCRNWFIDSS